MSAPTPGERLKTLLGSGALATVMLLWGLHLAYPMNLLQNARWSFFGYLVPVYYIVVVGLILGAAAAAVASEREWGRWEVLWWLLPLLCLPGILRSDDRVWSLRQTLSWAVRGVLPGGVLFLTARRRSAERAMLYWLYPIVVAASVLGLREIYTHHNPLWDRFDYDFKDSVVETNQPNNPFYRPQGDLGSYLLPRGTQGNRIPYAATLVAFLPIALWALRYKKRLPLLQHAALGALFSVLLLSRVRAVWLGGLASVFLLHAAGVRRGRRDALITAAALALVLGFFLAWPGTRALLWERMNSFHFAEQDIRIRLDLLGTAAVLKERWFAGVGFGQFPTACRPYYHGAGLWIGTADDQYLRWAIENGIPSFVLLALFFAGLIRAVWTRIKRLADAEEADFYRSLLIAWAGVALTFFFFDGFYWGACDMTFWCLLGLFASGLRRA